MDQGNELPTLQVNAKGAPKVFVFASKGPHLTLARVKRARFVQHLKSNYQKFKDALEFIERFAVTNQLSQTKIDAIGKAATEALDEVTMIYEQKIKAYEERMRRD